MNICIESYSIIILETNSINKYKYYLFFHPLDKYFHILNWKNQKILYSTKLNIFISLFFKKESK